MLVHVCARACARVRVRACVLVHTCTRVFVRVFVRVHVHVRMRACVRAHVHKVDVAGAAVAHRTSPVAFGRWILPALLFFNPEVAHRSHGSARPPTPTACSVGAPTISHAFRMTHGQPVGRHRWACSTGDCGGGSWIAHGRP